MSNLLADFEPRLEPCDYFGPGFFKFSFRCPTCGQERISVIAKKAGEPAVKPGGHVIWDIAGELPQLSVHPSIWQHGHLGDQGEYVECEWHRCIFKGRFIDELFAWPVEDPVNAKFG